MMSNSGEVPVGRRGRPSDPYRPQDAVAEMKAARARLRPGLRWHVYELLGSAVLLSGATFIHHAYRENLTLWLWVAGPVILAGSLAMVWRRRVVGRVEARLTRIAVTASIFLAVSGMLVLDEFVPASSAWVPVLVALPALPPLAVIARLVLR